MSKRELLFSITKKDFDIHYFSGTGAGGQHRNRHMNSVRLHHRDSGARSTGQSSKSRQSNLTEAFKSIREKVKFKLWYNQKVLEAMGKKTIEQEVRESVQPKNLKIEGHDDQGRWVEVDGT